MSKIKTTHKTLANHLRAFADFLDDCGWEKKLLKPTVDWFNQHMDELLGEDAFGTEGQNDPRGDHRG